MFERFEELIEQCGPYEASPAKTRITFMARVRFAGVSRVSERGMTCAFALPYPLRSRRFSKVERVGPGWYAHWLRVESPEELDDEVQKWLRESYRLMGQQERLSKTRKT